MKNYPNGKIYKITNDFSEHVYIGSMKLLVSRN